ncbi:MAG: NADH pyrophosphatase [Anaerolineales bacterium]|nr:NADH pyrophosphatase [Anaerolineales bacterium]
MPSLLEARFCPICAAELETRLVDDKERLVCPACSFILYINPKVAAGMLIEDDNKVVLVQRGVRPAKGTWALPSGFAEYEESIEESAVREALEETGLQVEVDDLLGVYSYHSEVVGRGVLVLFSGHVVGGEMRAGDDADEVGRFGPDELPPMERIAFSTHRQALHDWKQAKAVVVRPATVGEANAVTRMRNEHEFLWERDYTRFVQSQDRELFVATEREEVVGFANVSPQANGTVLLEQIFVLPQYRRWGIATRLIDAVIGFGQQHEARALISVVPAVSPALIVYLKAGFRIAGFDQTYYPENTWGTNTALFLAYDLINQ